MSVAKKSYRHGTYHQRLNRVAHRDQVVVLVDRRAMHELQAGEFADLHWTLRKRAQPLQILRTELTASPLRGQSCDGIEIFEVHEAADGLVMVTANENFAQLPHSFDDLVGTGAVADNVAQV